MTQPGVLIVNADDFGLTSATARTILELGLIGAVTSTSVLVTAPGAARWVEALASSGLGIGLHLAVVGEDPLLLGRADVPTLVDRDGLPPRSWRQLLRGLVTRRIDPADIGREFAAQLAHLRALGADPDHLDCHQHVQLWPSVGAQAIALARPNGLRIRVPDAIGGGLRNRRIAHLARRFRRYAGPLAGPPNFAGLIEAGHWTVGDLTGTVTGWGAAGVTQAEIGCHPGADEDSERFRYRWGYRWGQERAALSDPRFADTCAEAGFRLGTYADLDPVNAGVI